MMQKALMKHKYSQISIFLLISIIVLLLGILFFIYNENIGTLPNLDTYSNDFESFTNFFDKCIEITAKNGIRVIGLYGGFTEFKEPHFSTESLQVNYVVYNFTIILPKINEIEVHFSDYLKSNIPKCVNFSIFKEFEFQDKGIDVNSSINDESVEIKVDWDLDLLKSYPNKKNQYRLPSVTKEYQSKFVNTYKIAESISIKSIIDSNYVDSIFLIGQFSNITYSVYSNDTVVYLITDNQVIDDNPYYFVFATKIGG